MRRGATAPMWACRSITDNDAFPRRCCPPPKGNRRARPPNCCVLWADRSWQVPAWNVEMTACRGSLPRNVGSVALGDGAGVQDVLEAAPTWIRGVAACRGSLPRHGQAPQSGFAACAQRPAPERAGSGTRSRSRWFSGRDGNRAVSAEKIGATSTM